MKNRLTVMQFIVLLISGIAPTFSAADAIRIGTLAFGTVNWELAAIRNEGLDKQNGFELVTQALASPEAGKIGLKAGSLDIIATDWIWVANQVQSGADYRFVPHSTHAGALIVAKDSPLKTVADLKGKKLGIVGGPLDKNWLLLKAYAQQKYGLDLESSVERVFGAPPLLNQQLKVGKLDALINFWHYAVKLENQGFRELMDGRDIVKGLGIAEPMANVGFVFKQSWAEPNSKTLDKFLDAAAAARQLLCSSDPVWVKVAPLTQETDVKLQDALRKGYCAGIVQRLSAADREAAGKVYVLLRKTGGEQLTGPAEQLPQEIFWPYQVKSAR